MSSDGRTPGDSPGAKLEKQESCMSIYIRPTLLLSLLSYLVLCPVAMAHWTAEEIADRYGLAAWNQFAEIEFTFNVQLPDQDESITRQWSWSLESGEVTQVTNDNPQGTSVDLNTLGEGDKRIHSQFINDTYWFLFPFQLVWSNPSVREEVVHHYPIDLAAGQNVPIYGVLKVICQWPAEGGYTPGDAYDLYLDDDGLIKQWVFRRGGKPEGHAHTWENHQQLGPIVVCLDHYNADKTFRLWFTDVKATLTDGTVVTPVPRLDLLESP